MRVQLPAYIACVLLSLVLCGSGSADRWLRAAPPITALPLTGDWQTAVHLVQRVYPGSERWLLDCSASEGSHGPFVYHGGRIATSDEISRQVEISTPGGWMQYFPGTFWTDFHAAIQDLHRRGLRVPRAAWSWYSPLGQALAAGWAWGNARPEGKWTGGGCWSG